MKRICAILLFVLLVLLASGASAEEFTLHKGTKFGMTVEEVEKIEKPVLSQYKASYPNGVIEGFWTHWNHAVMISGYDTVAKQPNTLVAFCWNSNTHSDKLDQVMYFFESTQSYDYIETALTEKYGRTEYTHITGASPFRLIPFEGMMIIYDKYAGKYDFDKYSHRVVDIGDGSYAVVQHITFHGTGEKVHVLIYRALGKTDMDIVDEYFSSAADDL